MKKLLYMGLSALMMLLALMGVGKAQEVTFSPVAGTVPDGSEITITKTGNGTIYYSLYSSLSEAQNDPAFNGNGDDDAFYAAYGSTLIDYGNTHPVITTGKTVIRVGLHDDGWVKTDIYAEYTIASSGPSVTFSPAPNAAVAANQEITISYSGNGTIYYSLYSSLSEAQNDPAFNGNGDDDAFYAAYGSTLIDYGNTHPVITTGKTVIRVGIHDDGWVKTDIYAEYTITGGETPGPDDPTPTTPIDIYEFSPASGSEVNPGQGITISNNGKGSVYYRLYATKAEAEADNDSWDTYTNSNLTRYFPSKRPTINENQLVVKANTWLTDDDKWDVFSYAEYTLKTITPAPDFTLTFNPDNAGNVEEGQLITISTTPVIAVKTTDSEDTVAPTDYSVYFKFYETEAAAEADTWNAGNAGSPFLSGCSAYANNNKPKISATFNNDDAKGTIFKVGIYDKRTYTWITSSFTTKQYTIGQTREPFVISFAPGNDEEVNVNTLVTLSTTPALSDGFKLYYEMFASESAAKGKTWTFGTADAPNWGDMTEYTTARKPIITDTMPVVRAAVWNASTFLWESDTVVVYTTPVKAPAFSKASGTVQIKDTVIVFKGDADSIFVAVSNDRSQYGTFLKYTTNDTIVIANDSTFVHAYAMKGDRYSDTADRIYSIEKTPVEPTKPAAPEFSVAAGQVDANSTVTIAKGTADSIFVAFGKTVAEAVAFAKHTADVTVTIVNDTVIRAYAMKDGKYSDTIDRAYTVKTPEQVTLTLDPADGSTINDGDKISITCSNTACDIFYAYYASKEEAEADAAWANYINDGLAQNMFSYNSGRDKPTPTVGKNVLRVGAWLTDDDDFDKSSFVATAYAEYTIEEGGNEEPIVLTFTPASGTEVEEGDTVKIECSNEETVVYFMMFDTKANAEAFDEGKWEEAIVEDVVLIYPEEDDEFAVYPVITKEKPVIKVGYATPDEEDQDKTIWNFIYAVYTIKQGQTPDPTKPAAPVFTPEAGAVDSNTVVTIAKGTADSIFVAFGKTVAEAVAFAKYTADVTVTIVKDTVIRAYAMKDGKYSDTIDRAYTLKPAATVQDTVETPIFSVEGEVEKGTKVTISCTTTGAKIYYTVNGDVPTAQSTEYTAQIVIDSAMTIKAIAVKEGSVDSKVAEASYTIKKVANEGAELAGVRLYPNPNNGEFNVSVPVRVQVEVFTVNGMLVKDMTIAQGNTQIRLENSGIYFVRFTAENGQAAVKRVIVR